ncbi:MAG: L-aspartate oxidase [Phycisphaerales bacterium]
MDPLFDQRRFLIPFRSTLLPQIFTDTLVIGAGVAGLRAALAAAQDGGEVIILCKEAAELSNTAWAQGGIAAALSSQDSAEYHVADTLNAGAGLCDEPIVRRIVGSGPARLRELLDWGLRLDRDASGEILLGQEGAHSHHRIVHADGDATGRELVRCLIERIRGAAGIRLFSNCFAIDLVTPSDEAGAPVMGAITHHPRYGLQMIWAKSTILAAGGAGMVYRETTNPRVATADGIAMAYRAGATVADMAFVQFHPTTLYLAGAHRSLISEAVRGEGAHLLDQAGHRFMTAEHPLAELAPRDIVSRAIVRRLATHGGTHVFLDVRHLSNFPLRFPGIASLLAQYDLDPARHLIPVNPAAHYTIGGVWTDDHGQTDVPGLFAAGEVSCTGLHGANRLASNSLLEGLVMGEVVGRHARLAAQASRLGATPGPRQAALANGATSKLGDESAASRWSGAGVPPAPIPIISDIRPSEHGELDLADVLSSLRSAMWRNAGIERTAAKLRDGADMIDFWARYTLDKIFDDPTGWQAQNMLLVAALITRSASWRKESRGCHWRADATEPSPQFRVHDCWRRAAHAAPSEPTLRPVLSEEPHVPA